MSAHRRSAANRPPRSPAPPPSPESASSTSRGRCLPYGESVTYWPLRELVEQAAGADGTRSELESLLGGEPDAARVAELLRAALGASEQGAAAAAEIFWAARRLLETLARRRPLLVVFEDLHWAEPTFLELVESLATQQLQAPLLLVCLSRGELVERQPTWAVRAASAATLELEPLSDDEAASLLDPLAGAMAPQTSTRLLEAAAGNPLFLEQLAASLEGGEWGEDRPPLPPTIQALLAARLDRLGPGEWAVLAPAAVVGRDFSPEAVAELLPEEVRPSLRRHLRALAGKRLVEPAGPGSKTDEKVRFRHILIQQAVYSAIPKTLRSELHEHLAGWLEQLSGAATAASELLGYHLEQAYRYRVELAPSDARAQELAGRAAVHLEAAGTGAHARGDAPAAARLLDRAASLLPPDDPARARALTGMGAAMMEAGDLDRAAGALDDAHRLASASGDERLDARAVVQRLTLGLQVETQNALAEAPRVLPNALDIFERTRDELGLCQAWQLAGTVHWLEASSSAAEAAWEKAAAHARRAGDGRLLADILGWLASAALWGSTPAREGIQRCEQFLAEVGSHRPSEAVIASHAAGLCAMQNRVAEAGALLARCRAIYDDLGPTMTSVVGHPESFVAMLTGDAAAAESRLRLDYASLEQMGERAYLATTAAFLAEALERQRCYDEAERYVRVSRETAADQDVAAQIVWRRVLARILGARGRLAEAERVARSAVELAARTDLLNEHGNALLALAGIVEAAQRPDEAGVLTGEGLRLYERKGNLLAAEKARWRLERGAPR